MTGAESYTMATEMNGGLAINETLFYQLLNLAKNNRENKRPWRILVSRDTSQSITTVGISTTYSVPSTARRYLPYRPAVENVCGERGGIQLVSGDDVVHLKEILFEQLQEYKDTPHHFAVDWLNRVFRITGTLDRSYTAHQFFIKKTDDITSSTSWAFPSEFHPILVADVVAMMKGAVDADDQNARMAPELRAIANATRDAMETWDNELQLNALGK